MDEQSLFYLVGVVLSYLIRDNPLEDVNGSVSF